MLKHVHLSPHRTRQQSAADTCSLRSSSDSTTSNSAMTPRADSTRLPVDSSTRQQRSSLAIDTISVSSRTSSGSPEPTLSLSLSSRSSSYCSLSEVSGLSTTPTTPIKIYCKCLRSDIEYKTIRISYQTTAREVINLLLSKFRMRHRDPKLFYLTLEVTLRKAGLKTTLVLDEDARPAALQACQPAGDARLALQTARGGLVRVYDRLVMPGSQYKSLLISERTTVDELIQILLNCYNSEEPVEQFSLYEVCEDQEYQRKLHPDDCPLQVQRTWLPDLHFHFLIRRNVDYRRSKSCWSVDSPVKQPKSTKTVRVTSLLGGKSDAATNAPRFSYYSDYDNYFYI